MDMNTRTKELLLQFVVLQGQEALVDVEDRVFFKPFNHLLLLFSGKFNHNLHLYLPSGTDYTVMICVITTVELWSFSSTA